MKRCNLTTSVVAGLAAIAGIASTANAIELNPAAATASNRGRPVLYPTIPATPSPADGKTTPNSRPRAAASSATAEGESHVLPPHNPA